MYVFSYNLPHALLAERSGYCTCATAVTWGQNGYQNMSQHRRMTHGKQNAPAIPPGN